MPLFNIITGIVCQTHLWWPVNTVMCHGKVEKFT